MTSLGVSNREPEHPASADIGSTLGPVLRVVMPYAVCSALWILFSDSLLRILVRSPEDRELWSIAKGWLFVAVTALMLGVLLRRELRARLSGLASLKESEERYRWLFDSNPYPMWVFDVETLRFLAVNDAAVAQYGYSRSEFLGMTLTAIRPPEDVSAEFLRAVKTPEDLSKGRVWRHRRKDGSILLAEVRSHRIELEGRSARLVLALDVTEKHRTEERFRELAETIEDVFWITDPWKRRMIYVSPAYERIWGRTRESVYAEPISWLDSIVPEDRERVRIAAEFTQASSESAEEYRILRPDGEIRWIRDRAYPVRDTSGEVERVVGVARDISSERRLEDQLRLAQKLEAVGQLAGGVAHDFNNLLAVVLMQVDALLEDRGEESDLRGGLEEIRGAAERAVGVTRQLLQFSRRQVLRERDVDVSQVVRGISILLKRLLGEEVELRLEVPATPLLTRADPGLLEQVVMNLAVNARDAMPRGGVLRIEVREIEFEPSTTIPSSTSVPGRYVRIRVADTGEGIPAENLPRIYEPFFTTKEPGKGTGLGLATVFGIVRQHGGWLHVESEVGEGTTFDVHLPVALVGEGSSDLSDARVAPPGGSETVFLVEDEPALRNVTRRVLERAGYRVLEAEDGPSALRLIDERGPVHLLLTDLALPGGMTGLELARALQVARPELRVIVTSGNSAPQTGPSSSADPSWGFLQKPARSSELLRAIRLALEGAPPPRPGPGAGG